LASGSIEISPKEQIFFLNKLYRNQLPFSEKNIETVKQILALEESNLHLFSGKTGTAKGNEYGWFVGHISTQDQEYTFATFIRGKGSSSGPKAKQITKQILLELATAHKSEVSGIYSSSR
jgi:beta-lactamase class D